MRVTIALAVLLLLLPVLFELRRTASESWRDSAKGSWEVHADSGVSEAETPYSGEDEAIQEEMAAGSGTSEEPTGSSTNGYVSSEYGKMAVRRWAEQDPQAAAAWAAQLPDGSARAEAIEQVALVWSRSDFTAATMWLSGLPERGARQAVPPGSVVESVRIGSSEAQSNEPTPRPATNRFGKAPEETGLNPER